MPVFAVCLDVSEKPHLVNFQTCLHSIFVDFTVSAAARSFANGAGGTARCND
jgi:hypothetical protein